jgi:hypothetical protein
MTEPTTPRACDVCKAEGVSLKQVGLYSWQCTPCRKETMRRLSLAGVAKRAARKAEMDRLRGGKSAAQARKEKWAKQMEERKAAAMARKERQRLRREAERLERERLMAARKKDIEELASIGLPPLSRQILRPHTWLGWFRRRLFLEGRVEEFESMCRGLLDGKVFTHKGQVVAYVAKKYFNYVSMEREQEICKEIETDADGKYGEQLRAAVLEGAEIADENFEERYMAREPVVGDDTFFSAHHWAFTNWVRYIRKGHEGGMEVDQERLFNDAPDPAAIGLVYFASQDLKSFLAQCTKVLQKISEEPEKPSAKVEAQAVAAVDTGAAALSKVAEALSGKAVSQ